MPCISSPIVFVVMTGFSGVPRACTHWEASKAKDCSMLACFGHRLIAIIEFFPVLGGIVALVDLLFSEIICFASNAKVTQQDDEKKRQAGDSTGAVTSHKRHSHFKNSSLSDLKGSEEAADDSASKAGGEDLGGCMKPVHKNRITIRGSEREVTIGDAAAHGKATPKKTTTEQLSDGLHALGGGGLTVRENERGVTVAGVMDLGSSSEEE